MAEAIEEETPRFSNPDSLDSQVREYAKVKATLDFMETRQKELREKIFMALDDEGFEDDRGNLLIDFDSPIEGIVRVEKQRRTTRKLDEPAAETIIQAKGIGDEVYKTIRVIDEDALMAMVYEGKVTEEELETMFPLKVTWALTTKKK